MAIKSGRVGVAPDQVDPYGRLKATDYLIELIREKLNISVGELNALHQAREHLLQELAERPVILDPVIDKPVIEEKPEVETVAEETDKTEVTAEESVSILKQSRRKKT